MTISNSNKENIRVRFAPSPTGFLHVGGLRAALFNWLFARHHNGKFLVRIEDTDRERSTEYYLNSIVESLAWAKLICDESMLIQSTRITEHIRLIEQLLKEGKAYKCYCPIKQEEQSIETGVSFYRYDNTCRNKQADNISLHDVKPFVVRFKIPNVIEHIAFDDLIRGNIMINREQLDDFIILRSDKTPTYNFVVVADDAFMRITHVLRGEDHISNTPKQILLYEALHYRVPFFGHLPLILGPDGSRLSKRHGATSVREFCRAGYLPDALCNYLARLGWSHGNQEIFTRDELISYFSLEHVGKKGAIFDFEKLGWVNSVYIKKCSAAELYIYSKKYLDASLQDQFANWSQKQCYGFIDLYKERYTRIKPLFNDLIYLHNGQFEYSQDVRNAWSHNETISMLIQVAQLLNASVDFTKAVISSMLKEFSKEHNIKMSYIGQPLRLALTGSTVSPSIFGIISLFGQEETNTRIEQFIRKLS